ncbi:MAG: 50S ribosomal protein L40e [Nanoarchaeota archaeon]|nr:50S ribosomal protein L40e [Nanoarchaeota archaeon]MBU1703893.1 50S ribosomal protein L40e [Nanoarchaeota archaeon]
MAKFPEADARIFRNKFVCKSCKSKTKTSNLKVLAGKVTCANCGSHAFRPVRKK